MRLGRSDCLPTGDTPGKQTSKVASSAEISGESRCSLFVLNSNRNYFNRAWTEEEDAALVQYIYLNREDAVLYIIAPSNNTHVHETVFIKRG